MFEQFFHLEYSDSYTCNIHHYCICHSQGTAFETLLALNYNSFIATVAIIGVGIYSIEAEGYHVFDSHARDMYHNSHSEGTCVLLEIPSIHKLVQYFQTPHRNDDVYELKAVHIATFEPYLFSSNVEHCSISNVNSYQCPCTQCYPIEVYAMCYSLINPCGYWTVSISGAELNLTLRAVTTYVLFCNLAPSMSALKMCIFSNIVVK